MILLAMSDTFWTAFFTALPAVLTSIFIGIGLLLKQRSDSRKIEAAVTQTKNVLTKTNEELSLNTDITRTAAQELKTVKRMVNGSQVERDKRVDELQAKMEAHGIDCTPHGDKPT